MKYYIRNKRTGRYVSMGFSTEEHANKSLESRKREGATDPLEVVPLEKSPFK